MSEHTDPKELLGKIEDTDLRQQLESVFGELSGSALRQQVNTLADENKTLKAEKRQRTYKDAGIPEASFDVLDKVYDGELDPEAVRTFAREKGFAVPEGDGTPTPAPDPAAQRAAGEQRLAQVGQGAIPARDPSLNDQIAQAEAAGDWDLANRLNAEKLEAVRRAS